MYLAFDEVANACFCHDGDGHVVHDLFYHLGVAHSCYAALGSDVCWYALEGHDGCGPGFFCYSCLGSGSVFHASV